MTHSTLLDKVYGCLLGAAIGDAFGIRVEMMHFRDIEAQYGRVTHFDSLPRREPTTEPALEHFNPFGEQMELEDGFHPLGRWSREVGAYTDDTRYQLIAYQAILRKGGPINGINLADEWLNYRLMAEGASEHAPTWSWAGPERAYARYVASRANLTQMAVEQRPCISGWDGPMGMIHAGDPQSAAEVGSGFAVAIASAMTPSATIDTVIDDVIRYRSGSGVEAEEFAGRIQRLVEIAATCNDVFDLREPFYQDFLVSFPPWEAVFALEMVPCALALTLIADGDPEQAVIGATNLGRDADTIAGMAGQLCGALKGAKALPADWVDKVNRHNPDPDLSIVASDLCQLLIDRSGDQQRRVQKLLSME